MSLSVDAEWEEFLGYSVVNDSSQEPGLLLRDDELENNYENSLNNAHKSEHPCVYETPKPTDIYISTKTKIAHFNQPIDLKSVFWKINVQRYCINAEGVIKKQMKFNSLEKQSYDEIQDNLKNEYYFDQHVITHIENATGRILFKDIRKVMSVSVRKTFFSTGQKRRVHSTTALF